MYLHNYQRSDHFWQRLWRFFKPQARAYFSYGDFIDWGRLLTRILVHQGCTLENWRSTFESFMIDTIIYMYDNYNITIISFRSFCVAYSSDVCYIHRIWLIFLVPRQVHGHSRQSLLFLGTYSHTWVFPSVRVVF